MSNIKDNKNWNKDISEEDIFNKEFSIGYLLQTNDHPLIKDLRDKVLSRYKVKAKFTHLGFNGDILYCNGQKLIYAKSKFEKDVSLGKNVNYIEGNLKVCGSNKYPSIGTENSYCIIEFISYGLPYIDKTSGWSIELLNIKQN